MVIDLGHLNTQCRLKVRRSWTPLTKNFTASLLWSPRLKVMKTQSVWKKATIWGRKIPNRLESFYSDSHSKMKANPRTTVNRKHLKCGDFSNVSFKTDARNLEIACNITLCHMHLFFNPASISSFIYIICPTIIWQNVKLQAEDPRESTMWSPYIQYFHTTFCSFSIW